MGRDYKAECGVFMVVILEAYLHCSSELEVDSLHLPGSLWVWVFLFSQSSTSARAMKRTQLETVTQDSYFIGLWLVGSWLGPATPEALLVSPPHQHSMISSPCLKAV